MTAPHNLLLLLLLSRRLLPCCPWSVQLGCCSLGRSVSCQPPSLLLPPTAAGDRLGAGTVTTGPQTLQCFWDPS
jgi:hypothetical protein